MKSLTVRKLRLLRLFLFTLIGLIGLGLLLGTVQTIFLIKAVTCSVDNQPCPESLEQKLQAEFENKSIFFTNFELLLQRPPFTEESVTLLDIRKRLPSQVEVDFESEPNAYAIALPDETLIIVAQSGVTKIGDSSTQLITVVFDSSSSSPLNSNNTMDATIHVPLQQLVEALEEHQIDTTRILWRSPDEIILWLGTGEQAILDASHPDQAIAELQAILGTTELESLNPPVREIDLRFNLPVLRT